MNIPPPMNAPVRSFLSAVFAAFFPLISVAAPPATGRQIPEPLKPWEEWATWNDAHRRCPTPYHQADKHLCFWPSRLDLQIDRTAGRFELTVTVFNLSWIPLPGTREVWPLELKANGKPIPVVEHDGAPSIHLEPGVYKLEGVYRWDAPPQRMQLPREIGLLALTLEGKAVETPAWDAQGCLWLKRDGASEEAHKDFLAVKAYAVVEDGIPLWLRTEVELIVSGKSREEEIGCILPQGWKLSAVESPLPVAVDESGRMKAQVRAGKWTVRVEAFRLDNPTEIQYPPGVKLAVADELIAFRSKPDFRTVEIVGAPAIDVSQTTFPEKWRELPVYRWNTATPIRMEERLRGMGTQKPEGLHIAREWWLDENGKGLTFRDRITGNMQQIWRLDAAAGQDLGSVRSGGQGQLITQNPHTGAPGVELRTRNIDLEATGRVNLARELSASGWRSDADALKVTMNLPPGWRLVALFGADWVKGDWLTAWTLLDLFLLLVFTMAVFRLWGPGAAVLAFVALGLSYHEPGAPRYAWIILLMPLALLRVVTEGWGHRLLLAWKWVMLAALILTLAPFLGRQVQQAIYPQLEQLPRGRILQMACAAPTMLNEEAIPGLAAADLPQQQQEDSGSSWGLSSRSVRKAPSKSNLFYDTKARIQTGPGVPEWSWRTVSFGWNGPVSAGQQVRPVLISIGLERGLTALRVLLLLALASVLLEARRWGGALFRAGGKTAAGIALFALWAAGGISTAQAQMPDQALLKTLRERLLEPSDAYPNAADIPSVRLTLNQRRVSMDVEIHTAIRTAVPLPGRLAAWSPLTVLVDGKPEVALRRGDGYLWVVLPEGVHRVRVEGLLAEVTEWEWTFQLKPHRVTIEAPGWTFSGVRPDGVPEQQVFFALQQKSAAGTASYDRQDLQSVALVERHLEIGLIWQVRTTVKRLSPEGKALALRIPLLAGENVLSSNAVVKDGFVEVRLGAHEPAFTWESELSVAERIKLSTKASDAWVEQWHLVASPVWNVTISGLAPIFEPGKPDLIPVWRPWPGEGVELAVNRPVAIAGATVTVSKARHEITLGNRQRVSKLDLTLQCSLGGDFLVGLPTDAEITSLQHNQKAIPVRKDGSKLIIPLRPGAQSVAIGWKTNALLGTRATAEEVRLPVESANISTVIRVPENRWVLWAQGPLRGPAVRFWGILVCSLIAAGVLGRLPHSPLRPLEWMLLAVGLTQVSLPAALVVILWLFLLAWRGSASFLNLSRWQFNLLQLTLILLSAISLGVLIDVVAEGLLGKPEMFILGNGSSHTVLKWYQARCEAALPQPGCLSVSIWWYRFLMLAWALWLASSLIRWLRWGWGQFSTGECFRPGKKMAATPPPLPKSEV